MVDDKAIARAAARADSDPTDAQKAAGNYRKGHVTIHGMDVAIENARGSRRSGKGHGGKKWSVVMPAHYGYVKGSEGADGDHHDVYVGPMSRSPIVFVIDQKNAETGKFDEHKSMLGFRTIQHAAQTYVKGFSDGKGRHRLGGVTIMTVPQFKGWLKAGKTKHPLIMDHADRAKAMQHFDDGGAVQPEDGDDVTGTVQAPQTVPASQDDDIPTISWQEAARYGIAKTQEPHDQDQSNADVPTISWDEAAKYGITKQPGQEDQPQLSAGSSAAVSGLRSIIPSIAAIPGAAAGAEIGGGLGVFGGPLAWLTVPVGMFIGGLIGAFTTGGLANMAQNKVLDVTGARQTVDQYSAAAATQHPYASLVGDLAPNLAAFRFDRAATAGARLLGAAIFGGQETIQEAMNDDQSLDPIKIAMAAGAGTLFTNPTRFGERLLAPGVAAGQRINRTVGIPGRPDMQPAPGQTQQDVDADKADAATSPPPQTSLGTSQAMPPPNEDVSVGNNTGVRSDRVYPKGQEAGEGAADYPTVVGPIEPAAVDALRDALGVDVSAGHDPDMLSLARKLIAPTEGAPNEQAGLRPVADQAANAPQPQAGATTGEPGAGGEAASPPGVGEAGPPAQPAEQQGSPAVTQDMFNTPDERQAPPPATPQQSVAASEQALHPMQAAAKAFMENEQGSISPAQFFRMTQAVGGAFSGPVPHVEGYQSRRPGSPAERTSRTIADRLQQVNAQDTGDMVWGRQLFAEKMPQHIAADRAMQERIYNAIENGTVNQLTGADANFYKAWLEVLRAHNDQLYAKLRNFDPNLPNLDPNYMHKLAVGHQGDFEPTMLGADVTDPVIGARGLSQRADSLESPTFVALEAGNGRRAVISPAKDGFVVWQNGKQTFVKSNDEIKLGEQVHIGNAVFDVKRANTAEVEQHALNRQGQPMQYYKNASLSILKNNIDLRAAVRHMEFLESLKNDPDFLKYATTDEKVARENNWTKTKMGQFQGWFMDPHIAEVFDDFARPGIDAGQAVQSIRQLSQRVTSTLFWMPVPHALNVFWHWWVGRGWDWIKPTEWGNLAGEMTGAFKSVISQDAYQKRIADAGAGTVYRSVFANPRDFATNMAKAFGEDVKRNPSAWDPIARTLGVDPRDLVHMLYRGSQKAMWSFNDVLLTHQIMANERQGMPLDQAIKHAERHIPNYRIPSRILSDSQGGRFISQVLSDPLLVAFGRYHYGVYNSLAHMVKGVTTGTGGERKEALGNLFALGLFAFVAKPLLDKMAQYLTGNPHAETQPRGPMSPIQNTYRAVASGTKDMGDLANAAVTLSPLLKTTLELYRNRDFADRPIVERAQVQGMVPHSVSDVPRAAADTLGNVVRAGEHITRGLVTPLGQAEQVWNKGQGPIGGLRDLLLDIRNPSQASTNYEAKAPAKNNQALQQRFKKPRGMLEQGYHAITGR
jgi:hypothetical protein